jgi:hypothetical protein
MKIMCEGCGPVDANEFVHKDCWIGPLIFPSYAELRAEVERLREFKTCVKCKTSIGRHDVEEFYKE